jgi:Pentapeptide repeats (8 copies)
MVEWQSRLLELFNYMLRLGMPMEQLQITPFKDALFQSRNAEESLLVALNGCSRLTERVSVNDQLDPTAFGAWFKRIQGQRKSAESVLATQCLSFMDLHGADLYIGDFYGANLRGTNLRGISARSSCFEEANLLRSNLRKAFLSRADLRLADLRQADLREADLREAELREAELREADLNMVRRR